MRLILDAAINTDISTLYKGARDDMHTVELIGRKYEDAECLRTRLDLGDTALWRAIQDGMPKPIKIGNKRFFDSELVDRWLVSRTK